MSLVLPTRPPPRILLLEDSDIDAELIGIHLERAPLHCELLRATRRHEFEQALDHGPVDLVLADYSLPDFDGLAALDLVRERQPQVPFVFVSGIGGEELATNALRRGATDYVMKRNLSRLAGSITRALAEARERAERQRVETALQESEANVRLAVDAAQLGLWQYDGDTAEFAWDERCQRMLDAVGRHQMPLAEFLGHVLPEDREALHAALERTLRGTVATDGDATALVHECRLTGPAGSPRWVVMRGQKRGATAGGRPRLTGLLQDVSEQHRLQAALREANVELEARVAERTRELTAEIAERSRVEDTLRQMQRLEAIGQLTSGVAHDFNNLLMVVISNISLISRLLEPQAGLDPRVPMRLASMRDAAKRGATLTRQLLAFSRRQRLEPQAVDFNEIVLGMRDLLQTTIGGAVHLQTELADGLWRAMVDPTQLELIILNLAINARDAMEVGGSLRVRTANVTLAQPPGRPEEPEPGDYVSLSVIDTGTGMSEEVLSKAFEPFFTTKEVGKGSGLGLAQAYGFAKQSGGGVRIDTQVGQGTAVHVFMPRARVTEDAQAAPPPPLLPEPLPPGRGKAGPSVLVVDDDHAVREATTSLLQLHGFQVTETSDGEAALALAAERDDFELVVADFAMPRMNGAELARGLRKVRPQLPVVFMTGYSDLGALEDVPEEYVLQKPIDDNALVARLSLLLDKR